MSILLPLAISLGVQATPAAPPAIDLTPTEKVYGVSLFWKEASDHFAFFDKVPDLDWNRAYQEALGKVLATRSKLDYYRELQRFCALLKDGHTNVYLPQDVAPVMTSPGVAVVALGKRAYVSNMVKPLEKEIPAGSEIVAIKGVPLTAYLEENAFPFISSSTEHIRWRNAINSVLWGPGEGSAEFTIVTPKGERRDVSVARRGYLGAEWAIAKRSGLDLPPGLVQHKDLGGGIAYVALNGFGDMKAAEEFEALMPRLSTAKGLILDLRNNGGGNDEVGIRIARHFTRESFKGYAWKTREVRSSFRAWGQFVKADAPDLSDFQKLALKHYLGTAWYESEATTYQGLPDAELLMPKVVLTGNSTASAAEDMLIFLDSMPNITTVGQRTYGSTGQPYSFDLPGGGKARVCTHRLTYPDGREFVGIGVIPKVELNPTIEDWLGGRDVVLEKGLEVLKANMKG